MSAFSMSAFAALRNLACLSIVGCGLITAAWSGARNLTPSHDRDRGDVIWINTDHR
jgi:hypothetical protein